MCLASRERIPRGSHWTSCTGISGKSLRCWRMLFPLGAPALPVASSPEDVFPPNLPIPPAPHAVASFLRLAMGVQAAVNSAALKMREENAMKNTHRAWSLVAMLLLLSPLAAFAQTRNFNVQAQGPYQDVQIQVKDLDSDQIIATVKPGGTVT